MRPEAVRAIRSSKAPDTVRAAITPTRTWPKTEATEEQP